MFQNSKQAAGVCAVITEGDAIQMGVNTIHRQELNCRTWSGSNLCHLFPITDYLAPRFSFFKDLNNNLCQFLAYRPLHYVAFNSPLWNLCMGMEYHRILKYLDFSSLFFLAESTIQGNPRPSLDTTN
jgi:hypothetical protein